MEGRRRSRARSFASEFEVGGRTCNRFVTTEQNSLPFFLSDSLSRPFPADGHDQKERPTMGKRLAADTHAQISRTATQFRALLPSFLVPAPPTALCSHVSVVNFPRFVSVPGRIFSRVERRSRSHPGVTRVASTFLCSNDREPSSICL